MKRTGLRWIVCGLASLLALTSCSRREEPSGNTTAPPPAPDRQPPAVVAEVRPPDQTEEMEENHDPAHDNATALSPTDRAIESALNHLDLQLRAANRPINLNHLPPEIRERMKQAAAERKKAPLRYKMVEILELEDGHFLVRFDVTSGGSDEVVGSREIEVDSEGLVRADRMKLSSGSVGGVSSSSSTVTSSPR